MPTKNGVIFMPSETHNNFGEFQSFLFRMLKTFRVTTTTSNLTNVIIYEVLYKRRKEVN